MQTTHSAPSILLLTLPTLPLRLSLGQLSNKHMRQPLRTILLLSRLEPRTHTHSQEPPIARKVQCCYACRVFLVLTDSALGDGVPEGDDAVAAAGGEGVVDGVEGEGVDGVDYVDVCFGFGRGGGLTVAFECVFSGLRGGGGVEPFYCYAAFDGGGCVAGVVGHAGDGAGHEFEGGFAFLPGLDGLVVGGGG